MRLLRFALMALAFASAPALGVQPNEVMKDPALEARARTLSAELRCMVCQNQSIDVPTRRSRATSASSFEVASRRAKATTRCAPISSRATATSSS
jgi:cytochrome c-type biogenesis protein CcmH/NrfF